MLGSKLYSTFDPRALGDCALWLDAADRNTLTLSGSNVTRWSDKSGYNRHADASLGAPATDSNSGLYFSNSFYATSLSGDPANETAFVVFNTSNSGVLLGGYSSGRQIGLQNSNTIGPLKAMVAWGPQATFTTGVRQLVTTQTSSTASSSLVNGGSNSATGSGFTFTSSGVTTFGREAGSSFPYIGFLHEVILYSSILTAGQCRQVEGYLAKKWAFGSAIPPSPTLTVGNPLSFSGLVLWLDAADSSTIDLSGTSITQWRDKSGTGNNATQGTLARAPTYVNSNTVRFVGSNSNVMAFPNGTIPSGNSPYSIFFAITIQAGGSGVFLFGGNNSTNSDNGFYYSTPSQINNYWQNADLNGAPTLTVGNRFLLDVVYNQNVNRTMAVNGTIIATAASSNHAGATSNNYIGAEVLRGFYSTIDYNELLIYNTALSASQRQTIVNYLLNKWPVPTSGINLLTAHPYRLAPPVLRAFNPTDIDGCSLWLDAADNATLTLSGSNITTWADKSGNQYDASQSTVSNQPLVGTNTITFQSNLYFNIPQAAINNASNYSIILAMNLVSASNYIFVKQHNGVNTYNVLSTSFSTPGVYWGNSNYLYWRTSNAGTQANSGQSVGTGLQLLEILYDGSNVTMYKNGTLLSTTAATGGTANIANVTNATNFTLGAWDAGGIINGNITDFRLGELLFYNTVLTSAQRQQVEMYLAAKWGLKGSTPSGHPTRFSPALSVQFSPFQLSNCVFWLDAAQETGSNGAFVNTVSDYSPSRYSITATTNNTITVVRPGLNGLPHYSMGSNRFTVSSFTGTAAFTSAFVVQSSNSGFFFSHFTSGGSYTCYTLYQNYDLAFIRGAQWYDASLGRGGLIATNVWSIVITQYGLTGTVPPWRFNGSQRTSASGGGSALPTSNDSVTGPLFINGNNSSAWDSSRVAEILHFNAALSVAQCQQVEGYLAWKWGLQSNLPSGHPYRNNPPI